mgnify:CR=1 FL=1
MKLKRIASAFLAGALALSLAACGGSASTSAAASASGSAAGSTSSAAGSDLDYIKEKGKMVIGYTVYEPMNYTDADGNFTGFDTELATAVCEKLGVEPDFVEINWDTKIVELDAMLTLRQGNDERTVRIVGITEQRRPASEAVNLYEETAESIEKREKMALARKMNALPMPHPDRRPDKKERRDLMRFKHGESE